MTTIDDLLLWPVWSGCNLHCVEPQGSWVFFLSSGERVAIHSIYLCLNVERGEGKEEW